MSTATSPLTAEAPSPAGAYNTFSDTDHNHHPVIHHDDSLAPLKYAEEEEQDCRSWCNSQLTMVASSLGMFCNASVVMALGNIAPILSQTDPTCWGNSTVATDCDEALRSSAHYAVFAGITLGMLGGGYVSDKFGRRFCSIASATGMMFFNILIAASYVHDSVRGTFSMFVVSLGGFGVALGMEYPSAATAAAEKAEAEREDRKKKNLPPVTDRGSKVVKPILMQGIAAVVNSAVILILLAAFGQTGRTRSSGSSSNSNNNNNSSSTSSADNNGYNNHYLDIIWRLQYAVTIIPLTFLIWYRYKHVQDSAAWKLTKARADGNRGVFFRYYWHRLVGTAGGWFFWDLSFYGMKVFQAQFILLFTGKNASIERIVLETLYNNLVAFIGYALAVKFIDKTGRWWMQIAGFALMGVAFLVMGIWYEELTTNQLTLLRLVYYVTSVFGQVGPNATTWAIATEVFPTHVRSIGHGFSGAWGPGIGGALGALVMSLVSSQASFYFSAVVSLAGVASTVIFLPDVAKMNLDANDEFWNCVMQRNSGKPADFAKLDYAKDENLSYFEKWYWFKAAMGESREAESVAAAAADADHHHVAQGGASKTAATTQELLAENHIGSSARLNASTGGRE